MPQVNPEILESVLSEFASLLPVMRQLAERALHAPHFWESPDKPKGDRESLEAQAIVLLTTLDKPTVAGIARQLGIPRNTLRHWSHFAAACEKRWGLARAPRRGIIDADGDVDGVD